MSPETVEGVRTIGWQALCSAGLFCPTRDKIQPSTEGSRSAPSVAPNGYVSVSYLCENTTTTDAQSRVVTWPWSCAIWDALQQANSGHPGAPLGMPDIAAVLIRDFMQFDAADPHRRDHDRFLL
jgi:Transketolase, thiamine diphosphate binding domain